MTSRVAKIAHICRPFALASLAPFLLARQAPVAPSAAQPPVPAASQPPAPGHDAAGHETAPPAPHPAPDPAHPAPDPAHPTPDPAHPAPDPAHPAPDPAHPAPPPPHPAPEPPHPAPEPPPDPNEPLYSLEVSHQDAEATIMEFAKRANQSVTMLDRYSTRITVRFKNLSFEKGLRRLMAASDLDFVKDADGYVVGLPTDLKVRFPGPGDEIIDATYRCRRIAADTLVQTIQRTLGTAHLQTVLGPAFLTPAVERTDTTGHGDTIKALTPTDPTYRTHDVVFSGPPDLVRRALSLARKFDRPRKQVRVNVRIVEMTSTGERKLGVDWMDSLAVSATELSDPSLATSQPSSSGPLVDGIRVGKFAHSPITVSAIINAMESAGSAKTISNPTLLVLDGEKSFILAGQKYIYPQITSKDSSGQPMYTVTDEKVGIYLQVSVQIGLDDDMVLTIYPQVSTLIGFQAINGGSFPIIASRETQATVRAIQGDVIVLGGLKTNNKTYNNTSMPFLAHIPILGKLFSSDDKVHSTDELVFFLTPEIIDEVIPPLEARIEVHAPAQKPAP